MALSDMIERRMAEIEKSAHQNLARAADAFEGALRAVLSEPGTDDLHSRPGEAPRKQSGMLLASIVSEVDAATGVATIGPTAPYAERLLQMNRPFYTITIDQCRTKLGDIIFDIKAD